MFKIACYGVRPNEVATFNKYNNYDYDLTLIEDLLTHDNIETAKGHDAVLLRANCTADAQNLAELNEYGIRYVFTRTVGYGHIDLTAAGKYNMEVARVPAYSPNAIAELALTLGMSLLRHTTYTTNRTAHHDFRVSPVMFSKEVRNCTVGIIGTGKIGYTEAKLYKGLGAKVVGYDLYPSEIAKEVLDFVSLDELLAQSDIVSLHIPYFAGQNDQFINADLIAKMKNDAILVNTARGQLQDNRAIIDALKADQLGAFAADVLPAEGEIFFKQFPADQPVPDATTQELIDLYPRVLLTPHVGSNTDEALKNMVEISFENFHEILTTGKTQNSVATTEN
ncbi:2-hydroxyacid dehydrogenase [Latilactobacillus curvatus]|uniref:2-hydroxyacid dehydrogenase n=1 Tax=Latilactobacillus curvatus TaxID=28038 RepID=UPI000B60C00E|nr:2-hydroxyacid dehydrogenase [Latilactobacillus curvatus]ASN62201.1 lactate dehydrogenase [Latilactobacillus curvatus]MCT2880253.1 lactate dehydrogenase [Latilactobacillus curvatus]MCT3531956.1 lactate dehydrogenase [Latilactobacillus curvatus]MCW8778875.1 2-hydroxyacid dehydrogenase [Latilactobacillus curvatus]UTC14195.1 lactate dehydrogenase [Latilactobacillus curvatus]